MEAGVAVSMRHCTLDRVRIASAKLRGQIRACRFRLETPQRLVRAAPASTQSSTAINSEQHRHQL
eukprot:5999956-Pleurochrysis_carterae.AAC.5